PARDLPGPRQHLASPQPASVATSKPVVDTAIPGSTRSGVHDVGQPLALEQRVQVLPIVEIDDELASVAGAHLQAYPCAEVIGQRLFEPLGVARRRVAGTAARRCGTLEFAQLAV